MHDNSFDDKKNTVPEDTILPLEENNDTINPEESLDDKDENDSKIAGLEQEIASLKEQMLRALAEAENIRKRSIKEKEDASKYAVGDFSRSLLGVADNLGRALESSQTANGEEGKNLHLQGIIAGIEMTEKELTTVFEGYGIRKIMPKGEKFDPHTHQAVVEVESDEESGIVVDVLQAGYLIHDRVLRPAMVSVSKKK